VPHDRAGWVEDAKTSERDVIGPLLAVRVNPVLAVPVDDVRTESAWVLVARPTVATDSAERKDQDACKEGAHGRKPLLHRFQRDHRWPYPGWCGVFGLDPSAELLMDLASVPAGTRRS
jgi:hypothetical protein